jgi:hypothetical protein
MENQNRKKNNLFSFFTENRWRSSCEHLGHILLHECVRSLDHNILSPLGPYSISSLHHVHLPSL